MATVSIRKVWTFQSDSSSTKTYETLQYVNGTTSCNCPGWTRRIQNGIRTCKHTRYVDQGVAEQYCLSSHDYSSRIGQTPFDNIATTQTRAARTEPQKARKLQPVLQEPETKIVLKTVNKSGGRKIVW
jgi:hypothetical protein